MIKSVPIFFVIFCLVNIDDTEYLNKTFNNPPSCRAVKNINWWGLQPWIKITYRKRNILRITLQMVKWRMRIKIINERELLGNGFLRSITRDQRTRKIRSFWLKFSALVDYRNGCFQIDSNKKILHCCFQMWFPKQIFKYFFHFFSTKLAMNRK